MTENEVAKQIVDVAFNIHQTYGPGLLESVYEAIMAHELRKRGLLVGRQQPIPVVHDNVRVGVGFRADLIVESKLRSSQLKQWRQYTRSNSSLIFV